MISTLSLFTDCIVSFNILIQEVRSDLSKTKISVVLKDGFVIFLREIIIENVLVDYAYHGQKADGSLLIRWDNAAHYPDIITYPHHKHVGTVTDVEPSFEQNLFQVLSFIKKELFKEN